MSYVAKKDVHDLATKPTATAVVLSFKWTLPDIWLSSLTLSVLSFAGTSCLLQLRGQLQAEW
jgi:hypothetical protein